MKQIQDILKLLQNTVIFINLKMELFKVSFKKFLNHSKYQNFLKSAQTRAV
jgi:hypothetical protein